MTTDSVPIAWTKDSEPPLVAVISTHANNVKRHSQITQRLNAAVNIQTGKSTSLVLSKTTKNSPQFSLTPLWPSWTPQIPLTPQNTHKLLKTPPNSNFSVPYDDDFAECCRLESRVEDIFRFRKLPIGQCSDMGGEVVISEDGNPNSYIAVASMATNNKNDDDDEPVNNAANMFAGRK